MVSGQLAGAVDPPGGWLWGVGPGADHLLGRWLFLRVLGLVFLIAFVSLWSQLDGLLGSRGILPARSFLERTRKVTGRDPLRTPTLFWIDASDRSLHGACLAGTVLSVLLVVGWKPALCLLALWALYLSFTAVGQVFLSYQWDVLLLEAAFLGVFLAPWGAVPGSAPGPAPPAIAVLLLWWLLFRLVFQSGVGKLTSGDPAWRDLSALEYHYETQPLPTWTAWYAHQLPWWLQRASTLSTHVLEIGFPLLLFGPAELRTAAALGIATLQILIFTTGNYNFFNILTVGLCFLLVEDPTWLAVLPGSLEGVLADAGAPVVGGDPAAGTPSPVHVALTAVAAVVVVAGSLPRLWQTLFPARALPRPAERLVRALEPFRTVNSYGLFRVMTKERPEIVVEASQDGQEWRPYEFRWKPGAPRRRPRFVAPHQPRLDWQMWFAALASYSRAPWLQAFLGRLLEGSEPVEDLLRDVPYDRPPRYVRARLYRYRFTTAAERRKTGEWWERHLRGPYSPVLSVRDD